MIRAAMINETTGVVENIIMALDQDISANPNTIIPIPKTVSKDGTLSFDLCVDKNIHKWNGSMFTDLEGNEVMPEPSVLKKIEFHEKLLVTEQKPPEVI